MTNELDYDNGDIVGYKLVTGEEIIAQYARCVKDRLFKKVEGHVINYPSVLNNGEFVPWLQMLDACCHGGDIFLPAEMVAFILDEEVLDPVLVENFRDQVL